MSPFKRGDVAVVTGAASGIGRATARWLFDQGMHVAVVDLPGRKLDQIAEEISALKIGVDLSEAGAVQTMHSLVIEKLGPPIFLMNNAGAREGREWGGSRELWRKLMEVNFWSVVAACDAFVPEMPESGVIVNTGSKQGITNPPGTPIYNASKSALKTYTEALEHELRSRQGPRLFAHLLLPGWTTVGNTQHRQGAWHPEQVVEKMVASVHAGDFYIVCQDDETTPEVDAKRIAWGAGDITENRPPLSRWHPDWKDQAAKACS